MNATPTTDWKKVKSGGGFGRRGLPQATKDAMIADWLRLRSTRAVGELWGRSGQCVQEILATAGLKMTRRVCVDAIVYDGRKYTPGKSGYLRDTLHGRKQADREKMLHRHIWTQHHGPIPKGHDVIFLDGDLRNVELSNLQCLPRPEATRMKAQGENGHTKAKHAQRVLDYEGLVIKEAQRYHGFYPAIDLADFIQQGRLAIVKASKRYQPEAASFGTYARFWIRSEMRRWTEIHRTTVRLPANKIRSGQTITMASMDAPLGDEGDDSFTLADLIPCEEQVTTEADKAERYALIERVLKRLGKRERKVLLLRFWEEKTFEEIGAEIDMSQAGVAAIIQRTLKRFRRSINMRRAA